MTTTENETKVVEPQAGQKDETMNETVDSKKSDQPANETNNSTPSSPTKKTETLKPAITAHKKDFEKDVVYLYQFTRSATIPSLSACCLKVENWLRMSGIRYENVDHKLRFKSKKGQLPFVELNGKEIEDSDTIIKELSKYFDKELDFGLTEEQKTTSHAFVSMLNNHTGWIVRWWRYNNPREFLESAQLDIKRTFNSRFPNSILNFVFKLGFKKHLSDSLGLGRGRFTLEEIQESAKEDIKALSNLLGNKEYFFGKEAHLLDCVAFAHLAQFFYVPFAGLKEWMETESSNLIGWMDRMKTTYWPDWEEMCSSLELNTHLPKKEVPADQAAAEQQQNAADEESKKKKDEKKKKEKKEKKDKKKETNKDKSDEQAKENAGGDAAKDKVEDASKEPAAAAAAPEQPANKQDSAASNGGEAPKTEVTASE
uniref:Failed axon connections-like isoform X2 n=1 Tax=Dermatophagoides pteronyssinus TaxID=6956 RepID=A0A6P6XYR3_DERPT|nr:failed axon connections-like isoform X2 [Dermatophagoides pteronyssinus]